MTYSQSAPTRLYQPDRLFGQSRPTNWLDSTRIDLRLDKAFARSLWSSLSLALSSFSNPSILSRALVISSTFSLRAAADSDLSYQLWCSQTGEVSSSPVPITAFPWSDVLELGLHLKDLIPNIIVIRLISVSSSITLFKHLPQSRSTLLIITGKL